jgi:hypothetical protein
MAHVQLVCVCVRCAVVINTSITVCSHRIVYTSHSHAYDAHIQLEARSLHRQRSDEAVTRTSLSLSQSFEGESVKSLLKRFMSLDKTRRRALLGALETLETGSGDDLTTENVSMLQELQIKQSPSKLGGGMRVADDNTHTHTRVDDKSIPRLPLDQLATHTHTSTRQQEPTLPPPTSFFVSLRSSRADTHAR